MIFYGHGLLLLKGKKIRFTKDAKDIYKPGTFETDDKKVCDDMIKLGYEYSGEIKEPAEPVKEPAKKPGKAAKDAE